MEIFQVLVSYAGLNQNQANMAQCGGSPTGVNLNGNWQTTGLPSVSTTQLAGQVYGMNGGDYPKPA